MNDGELDLLLREMREEELPAAALAGVRAGVWERIHARRRWWVAAFFCAPAAVAVAALAVAVFVPLVRPVHGPEVALGGPGRPRNDLVLKAPEPAAEVKKGVDLSAKDRERPSRNTQKHARNAQKMPQKDEENALSASSGGATGERTEFIRIFTDDPDVVILWAMNSKGETR